MKKLILLLSLALAACTSVPSIPSIPPAPVEVANRTAADEQAAVAVENAYKLFRRAAELGVDAGWIKGDLAIRVAKADDIAYRAVLTMRVAYTTANSDGWLMAARNANAAIAQALSVLKGN